MIDLERLTTVKFNQPVDPRYHDDFVFIKQEVDKLSGADFAAVEQRCVSLLTEQAVDCRVAGFLLLALAINEGLPGFLLGLDYYQYLLLHWGEVFPTKLSAQDNAIAWLNNQRLKQLVEQFQLTQTTHAQLKQRIARINELLDTQTQSQVRLTSLSVWLDEQQALLLSVQQAAPAISTDNHISPMVTSIATQQDVDALVRLVIDYHLQEKNYAALVNYTRALVWQPLRLPTHANGLTRLEPPRQQAIDAISKRMSADPLGALLAIEALLLEPNANYYLDLQHMSAQAAEKLGFDDVLTTIECHCRQLLTQMPELIDLRYIDDKPFAAEDTKRWLSELMTVASAQPIAVPELQQLIADVRAQAGKQIKKQLVYLQQLPKPNQQAIFMQQYAAAKLSLLAKNFNLAMNLFKQLHQVTVCRGLHDWQPELALSLWLDYREALELGLRQAHADDRPAFAQRLQEINEKISLLDMSQVV